MPENEPADAHLAFLYAAGEMDAAEAAAFERRLGEEQALREALCQAVELMQALGGLAPPSPSVEYRDQVRRRLLRRGWWHRLTGRQTYRGHPALWTGLGAAAALLVALALTPGLRPTSPQTISATPTAEPTQPRQAGPPDEPDDPTTIEMAETWAHLLNSDHLLRAREEENRRRDRRLAHGEHLLPVPGSPPSVRR
jgi:hypothetical protein